MRALLGSWIWIKHINESCRTELEVGGEYKYPAGAKEERSIPACGKDDIGPVDIILVVVKTCHDPGFDRSVLQRASHHGLAVLVYRVVVQQHVCLINGEGYGNYPKA